MFPFCAKLVVHARVCKCVASSAVHFKVFERVSFSRRNELPFLFCVCEGVLFLEDRKNNGNRVNFFFLLHDLHGF